MSEILFYYRKIKNSIRKSELYGILKDEALLAK